MAQDNKTKSQISRDRKKALGLISVRVEVLPEDAKEIKALAKLRFYQKVVTLGLCFIIDKKINILERFNSASECKSAWWAYNHQRINGYYSVKVVKINNKKMFVNLFDLDHKIEIIACPEVNTFVHKSAEERASPQMIFNRDIVTVGSFFIVDRDDGSVIKGLDSAEACQEAFWEYKKEGHNNYVHCQVRVVDGQKVFANLFYCRDIIKINGYDGVCRDDYP